MKGIVRFGAALVAALAVAVVCVPEARADQYANGTTADGYTYRDGYWWSGASAYTRTASQVWVAGSPGYYSCGRFVAGTQGFYRTEYSYSPVAVVERVAEKKVVTAADPDWRGKLLDIAGQRDKAESAARKNAWEQQYFLQSVQALGLNGNFRLDGYGASPFGVAPAGSVGYGSAQGYGYAVPLNGVYQHQLQIGGFGVQGATVYGSSLKQVADLYGDANLNQLYQQAARLAENAQKLGGEATAGHSALVAQAGTNQARVAEILARAEAAQRFLNSLEQPRVETKTVEFGTGNPQPVVEATAKGASPSRAQFVAAWNAKCASCHTGNAAKAKFTLAAYDGLTVAEKEKRVWPLLVTADKGRVMPRGADPLSFAEVKLFIEN